MSELEKNFQEEYADIDISFRKNPVSGDVVRLDTEQSISQSLKNLVRIQFYEKHFLPNIGNYSAGALFELFDSDMVDSIKSSIIDLIQTYEPRVLLQDIKISEVEQLDANFLSVVIVYYIKGRLKEYETQILLQRVR